MININDSNIKGLGAQSYEQIGDWYLVYWILGNYCTYSCSYCPPGCHMGNDLYHPIDKVIKGMNKFPINTTIIFGGGEPTYHPNFEEILNNKPAGIKIGLISNGARPISFWERILEKIYTVTLSYHVEFANFDRFTQTATLLFKTSKLPGRINLPMHPKFYNECLSVFYKLKELNLPVIAKPIVNDFGPLEKETTLSNDYTKHQLEEIGKLNGALNEDKKTIKIFNKDNEIVSFTSPSELISTDNSRFFGWKCYGPYMGREILSNGDVVTMGCRQRKIVGNIHSDFSVREEPVICQQSMCWCHADLLTYKEKI